MLSQGKITPINSQGGCMGNNLSENKKKPKNRILFREIWRFGTLLTLSLIFLLPQEILSGQEYQGPQMADNYATWAPGDGPSGDHCVFNGVDINELTGFDGGFITESCNTVRAGDFWSIFVFSTAPESLYTGFILPYINHGLPPDNIPPYFDLIIDPGTRQETFHQLNGERGLVRDEDGEIRLYNATDLFPDDVSGDKMIVTIFRLPPERIGAHKVEVIQHIPGLSPFPNPLGSVEWTVVPR